MKIMEIKHAKKSFDGREVLKDISLTVDEGEVVSILGPSGSGKSTLLRCATFLTTMDCGTLSYLEKPVITETEGDEEHKSIYPSKQELRKAEQNFGLVFQNFNLFPHYSVLKNITDAPIHVQKRNRKEVTQEAMELLSRVGLEDKAEAYPCELSGGQQQRVAIARALAMKPGMLFFDEPTSALDPETTAGILRLMKELARDKMTMVVVTHEIDFARAVSSKVVFMDDGYVVEQGDPERVIDHPENQRTRDFLKKLSF